MRRLERTDLPKNAGSNMLRTSSSVVSTMPKPVRYAERVARSVAAPAMQG